MRKLGRGLSELGLTELLKQPSSSGDIQLQQLAIDNIFSGQFQPRKQFDQTALVELADSIRAQGILQPIIVRKSGHQRYEIIAGERRCVQRKWLVWKKFPRLFVMFLINPQWRLR